MFFLPSIILDSIDLIRKSVFVTALAHYAHRFSSLKFLANLSAGAVLYLRYCGSPEHRVGLRLAGSTPAVLSEYRVIGVLHTGKTGR
jgi:hypothetical protein